MATKFVPVQEKLQVRFIDDFIGRPVISVCILKLVFSVNSKHRLHLLTVCVNFCTLSLDQFGRQTRPVLGVNFVQGPVPTNVSVPNLNHISSSIPLHTYR